MEYADVKQGFREAPELSGLDEHSLAVLFWRGEQQALPEGEIIYAEDTQLDDTFGVLLAGCLQIEKAGTTVGTITGAQIFGEMAYFTSSHSRTATVRSGCPETVILKVQLSQAEMSSARFAQLRRFLGREAWDRFVSGSQTGSESASEFSSAED